MTTFRRIAFATVAALPLIAQAASPSGIDWSGIGGSPLSADWAQIVDPFAQQTAVLSGNLPWSNVPANATTQN
jgi:hypothetical protein